MKRRRETGMRRLQCKRYLLLGILTAVFCYLFCFRYGVFGSKVDWISQHSVLPDYFRQQFYETGELFPEFAANIGGGQNIYNFAYYGLYNPILMLSYLLPSVKMSDYMMAVQFLSLLASVLLMYAWLGRRGFPQRIRAGVTVMFLLSGPMIYHSYSQVMFVNYMPFLITGLWGADRYFECEEACTGGLVLTHGSRIHGGRYAGNVRRRSGIWIAASVCLMIMTSFYFSIGGMLVLVLYGIHRFLAVCEEEGKKVTPGIFLTAGIRFAVPFILAVLMSSVLLVPTALTLTGRGGESAGLSIAELLIPGVSASRFCYSTHGIGLTALALTALLAIPCRTIVRLPRKRHVSQGIRNDVFFGRNLSDKVLAWGCITVLTVPVFAYLLNGGLYVRDKAMIPFLPLLCYVLACYLNDLGSRGPVAELLPYALTAVLIYVFRRQGEAGKYWKLLLLDGAVMFVCYAVILCCRKWLAGRTTNVPECPRTHFCRLPAMSHGLSGLKIRQWSTTVLMAVGIAFLIVFGNGCHAQGAHAVSREFYQSATDARIGELIGEATEEEKGFYRTEQLGGEEENAANLNRIWNMDQYISSIYSSSYHKKYREFREDTFQIEEPFRNFLMQSAVHNPVYQRFMGVKYIVSDEEVPGYEEASGYKEVSGYEDTEGKTGLRVYQNDRVSPVAYTTDQVITEELYRGLEFPCNQLALLRYAAVKDISPDGTIVNDAKENAAAENTAVKEIEIHLPKETDSEEKETIYLDLPDPQAKEREAEVLFLKFRVKNLRPSKDVAVWVEGIRNKLTSVNHFYYNGNTEFTYAVSLRDGQKSVEVILGEGRYQISDAKAYLGILPDKEESIELYQSELRVDKERTKGNCIAGTIDVKRWGYLITTIPYDEHFEILIDGQAAEEEEVNTAFLGCRIEPGEHDVEILYHAPGVRLGKMISLAGCLLFIVYILKIYEKFLKKIRDSMLLFLKNCPS
ncbi:YfhO family protein [Lachnospiraceae bacterium 56-18]